jgi:hypothetical protein
MVAAVCALMPLLGTHAQNTKATYLYKDPKFRVVGGKIFDMAQYFGDDYRPLSSANFEGWCVVEGRVIQAKAGDGLLLSLTGLSPSGRMDPEATLPDADGTIYVMNAPFVADDDRIRLAVCEAGFHDYRSVGGANKRVRAYDCGVVPSPAAKKLFIQTRNEDEARRKKELEEKERLERAQEEEAKRKADAERERLKAAQKKLADERERRIVENLKKRIEMGGADACFELGLRYLKGNGVEADEVQARQWMVIGATRGSSEAKAWLENHPTDKSK